MWASWAVDGILMLSILVGTYMTSNFTRGLHPGWDRLTDIAIVLIAAKFILSRYRKSIQKPPQTSH